MRIEMPRDVEWIIGKIRDHGFEAFAVGGCVRDTLLNREPGDWDITTSAKPEEVKGIFGKTVDTGLQHGTVTIIKNRNGYEVTTYRIDGEYHDGRHPDSVEFTSNLKEDLKRRDFTINAMAYSHETGIVDEFGGMEDLENKMIRCVGCAHDRFTEDALRILRAIRFAAQLGFEIEDETYHAISDIAPNLKKVSKERIQVEMTKLLLSNYPEKVRMVEATGISPYVTADFPEVFAEEKGTWQELKTLPKEKSIRWAGFLRHMDSTKVRMILKGLKLDNETIDNGRMMVEAAQTPLEPKKPQIRRFLSRMSRYQFEGCLMLKALDCDRSVEEIRRLWQEIEEDGDCISLKTLAVNGGDLMKAGMKQGKEFGEVLAWLLDLVLEDPALNEKSILLEKLKERMDSHINK
ncbi:MAG: CCA tRNA nucleotidyltransferase [Lachnospiraceae bacterium]|nr:CCA tRNA nucleotidyltransferase [Lachnospiraceae bacterium]